MSLFGRGSWPEARRIGDILRAETVGGLLLIGAAVIALGWANSPWGDSYRRLAELPAGPLTLGAWAADGLLAIFFFVAGLELKREFVAGDLRDPRRAVLPVAAAVGGMAGPAVIFAVVNAGGTALAGWAIPTATDIAFALAVLGLISTHLPAGLRTFLLTLAVVDDLLAITIIAIFYTSALHLLPLLLAMLPLAAFGLLVQRRVRSWWLLLPLAGATWFLVHESGVHATVAGVLLAFTVPVRRRAAGAGPDRVEHQPPPAGPQEAEPQQAGPQQAGPQQAGPQEAGPGLAERFEHRLRPVSAGVAVPVFAFFSSGVSVAGTGGLGASLRDSVTIGVLAGLVAGKAVGITGATWLVQRFTRARLDPGLGWWDVFGLALLGGVGFTVALLIAELAYGVGSVRDGHAKIGILLASLVSALLATVVLRLRNRHYRRLAAEEEIDSDDDGIPDVYQR